MDTSSSAMELLPTLASTATSLTEYDSSMDPKKSASHNHIFPWSRKNLRWYRRRDHRPEGVKALREPRTQSLNPNFFPPQPVLLAPFQVVFQPTDLQILDSMPLKFRHYMPLPQCPFPHPMPVAPHPCED
ncbi:hypothetical protein DPX16_21481 [Anabarilius grahami]|uniref:Uncharacterized protein n=1 Tax=Anabarilius grahami TaxID=495550 RepID=A0A3N0XUK0_ANAGA|nr:hypothetical protein DPX16_21481 [Anabarilius grahami]